MNLFWPVQNKEILKADVVAEWDDNSSRFFDDEFSEYENPSKTAAEMENILGNALAMTERSNRSIDSLQRSGTNSALEFGRSIASMHSREKMAISDAHLNNNDSFENISRTSSLGNRASLPTFVKVKREDPVVLDKQSWDYDEVEYERKASVSLGCEGISHKSVSNHTGAQKPSPRSKCSNRSWNKLRREVDEESRPKSNYEDTTPRRTQSIGRKVFDLRKNILRECRSKLSGEELETSQCRGRDAITKNTRNRKGFAKDYDIEVSLQNRVKFWKKQSSILSGRKAKKASSTIARESENRVTNTEKIRRGSIDEKSNDIDVGDKTKQAENLDTNVLCSFDAPIMDDNDSSQVLKGETILERKSNVAVKMHEIHKGDRLFQALEVTCCHPINGEILDLITEMVPPQV